MKSRQRERRRETEQLPYLDFMLREMQRRARRGRIKKRGKAPFELKLN